MSKSYIVYIFIAIILGVLVYTSIDYAFDGAHVDVIGHEQTKNKSSGPAGITNEWLLKQ